jgi:hypothetical protein
LLATSDDVVATKIEPCLHKLRCVGVVWVPFFLFLFLFLCSPASTDCNKICVALASMR